MTGRLTGVMPAGSASLPLDTISRENVTSLEVVWTFRTGDAYQPKSGRPTGLEATALHINGTLYLSTPYDRSPPRPSQHA